MIFRKMIFVDHFDSFIMNQFLFVMIDFYKIDLKRRNELCIREFEISKKDSF